jgi:D-alanyl-D-alanine carboxypeptidase
MLFKVFFYFFSVNLLFGDFFNKNIFNELSQELTSLLILEIYPNNALEIIYEKNSEMKIHPASITKLMTAYSVLKMLRNDKLMEEIINISKFNKKEALLQDVEEISIRELMILMILKSSNEAAVILANEFTGGDIIEFIKIMNENALLCKMHNTNFINPVGYSDSSHYSTLQDIAKLSIKIKKEFPKFMSILNQNLLLKNGNIFEKTTLIDFENNVIGSKTGFTKASNYNIIFWIENKKKKFLVIFTGAKSKEDRDLIAKKIILQLEKKEIDLIKEDEDNDIMKNLNQYIKNYIDSNPIDINESKSFNTSIEENNRFIRK